MNLGQFSVSRPVAVTMRIASLVLLGAVCLFRLPVDLLPKVSFPTVIVVTQWANVAPEELETQITRPLEQAVSSATNIYQVSSTTTAGQSTIRVQFNYGSDVGQAAVDVLQLVERARQKFPTDPTLQTPIVFKIDPSQLPILIYGVSGESNLAKLKSELDNQVSPILQSANGVASATSTGGLDRAIIVDIDPDKLRAYHLALATVSKRIVAENIDLPAGIAKQSDTEYTIRSLGYFTSPQQAASIPIGSYRGQLVSLGQVANVRDSHQEQRIFTRLNGEDAVGMIIVKQSEANTVNTAKNVREKLLQVNKLYPNLKFGMAYDQSQFIQNSIDDVRNSALIGGALAVVILMFFLRNFRSTLVVALSIPISIISTFTLFYVCGFSLNNLSLSGLSLATGLIVDDAVVVLENIFRHIERDRKRASEAAVVGTNEITGAVVASTITIMVVFLPLLLIRGQAGQLFTQFALVVIFSISISMLDALTVVPMLASRFIKESQIREDGEHHRQYEAKKKRKAESNGHGSNGHSSNGKSAGSGHKPDEQASVTSAAKDRNVGTKKKKTGIVGRVFNWFGDRFDDLDSSYHRGLQWSLKHRWVVVGGALLVTASSLLLVPQIGTELLPQTDSGNFTVLVRLPVGTALSKTNATIQQAEAFVQQIPEVETLFAAAGTTLSLRGTTTTQTPYQGNMTIRLKDNRKRSTQEIMAYVQSKLHLAGARVIVQPYDIVTQVISGGNQNIEVDIYGQNLTQLSAVSRDVLSQVRGIPGMENADTAVQDATPELQFTIDREKALQFGISFSDIANTINTATNGTLSSYYQENGFQYPIYVQLPEANRKTVDQLLNLPISPGNGDTSSAGTANGATSGSTGSAVTAPTSGYITLGQVAKPYYALGPNEIDRQNSQRYIAITAIASGRPQSQIQADVEKVLKKYQFPAGYYWDYGLNLKQQKEEFSGLGLAVAMAIALIYMLLASQFESFVFPLTILMAVPLSVVGVILGLFLTGRSFGLTAYIGMLLLVGIVVKNGILLIDYTQQLRSRGFKRDDAVLAASPTRLRPILMTSSAAILGMVPLALGIGKGSETQAPLATAVIGGLSTSTVLTLFVVPVVYTLFDDLGSFFHKRKQDKHRSAQQDKTDASADQTNTEQGVPAGRK